MADDDRYKWLDEEAAERLLRGPVVNARGSARTGRSDVPDRDGSTYGNEYGSTYGVVHEGPADQARPAAATPSWARSGEDVGEERLAALLATLVEEQAAVPAAFDAHAHEAELPGEAAALAAFRAARLGSGAAGGAVTTAAASAGHDDVVLTGGRPAREKRRRFAGLSWGLGRPLRAGFAMAVAGVALGGVAVAAGTGVIPVPFSGDRSPAASVSPMVSPGTDDEQTSAGGTGSPSHSDSARPGSHGGTSSGPSGDDHAGTPRGQGGDKAWGHDGRGLSEKEKRALARELCGKYEDGSLPEDTKEQLEDVAGGAKNVKKFCAGHGSDGDARADGGADGGPEGDGDNKPGHPGGAESGGPEGGDQDGDSGGDSGGAEGGGEESGGGGSRPDTSGGTETTDPTGTPTPSATDASTASATDSAESTAEDAAPSSANESLPAGE
jgi:hypothetical protein